VTDWTSFIARFGFATAVACALMYFVAYSIVIPMRDDQKRFMDSVIDTNKTNTESNRQLSVVQVTQTENMKTLVENQKLIIRQGEKTSEILSQIRDDQRKFPAVAEKQK